MNCSCRDTIHSHAPGFLYKADEVVVVVQGAGNSGVVVKPFASGDSSVIIFVTEVGEELQESFIFSNLSRDDLWVSRASVTGLEISSTDATTSVKVELAESFSDNAFSGFVHLTSEANQEFVKVDIAISISVEVSEESVGLFLGEVASTLVESNEELLGINLSVTISVKGVEYSSEASESSGTPCVHLVSNLADN